MKLKHPTTGFVRDVADERRIQVLRTRGFVQVDDDVALGVAGGPVQRDESSTAWREPAPTEASAPDADDGPPAKSAPKAEWVAYAEAQGLAGAADMSKSELIEALGGS